ncbi:MAG: cyclic nucleotide-binding domain-containing protein [Rhodospirillaceae bacterium]|nr:cyclic nucleotide-binding domain-containing protein [Rhodospirillaceae bacterium]MBT5564694.1 cyclic nucleotide-binding domain-containing protein [Rhodospirillaceae bacterium]MBT6088986.1 cyclic nucleotide-binding domain-containing protein [Rhodospirillaceae bacterium]
MAERLKVAIVGSGPAGLSAAAHAAKLGMSHVLLERAAHASDTIYKYQKGKFVMATPDILPLRSDLSFRAGRREEILAAWDEGLDFYGTKIRYETDVTKVDKTEDGFSLTVAGGETIEAENVILSIGLQGNINKMRCDGGDLPLVQYQLDDPDEYEAETVVVIGGGDAAIENAVALSKQNTVIIINRRPEFARAKQGNLTLILNAIEKGDIQCYYEANPVRVEPDGIVLDTPDGEATVKCDRIIARLGASPPRRFVEACGVEFPSDDPGVLPEVSPTYESNVPGLYIVGALAGYPLIKQAMNQGFEVVAYINGDDIAPADEPLLVEKFEAMGDVEVDDVLSSIRQTIPVFSELNPLLLRETMLESQVHAVKQGDVIFARNDYSSTFFTIFIGQVGIQISADDPSLVVKLREGEFFGEMGLISGRRRTATVVAVTDCVVFETPRRTMLKLIQSVDTVKRTLDKTSILRQIQTHLTPGVPAEDLEDLVETAEIQNFKAGEAVFNQGDAGNHMHLIRSGSCTVSTRVGGREVVLSYVPSGNYIGEMALLSDMPRSATVRAANNTETICLSGDAFSTVMNNNLAIRDSIEAKFRARLRQNEQMEARPEAGNIIQFLIEQGVGEGTDVLLIDEALCVHCDNCEKACAETHGGLSRLDREAGPSFAAIHVPTSCRHCQHPHCMADCPPDAIHRAPDGEVFIDDSCIGCGNCVGNCPYSVIQLASPPEEKSNLFSWLLFGNGPAPGEQVSYEADLLANPAKNGPAKEKDAVSKKAVKCDMCKDLTGGAACVNACPTGAAARVSPEEFMSLATLNR